MNVIRRKFCSNMIIFLSKISYCVVTLSIMISCVNDDNVYFQTSKLPLIPQMAFFIQKTFTIKLRQLSVHF